MSHKFLWFKALVEGRGGKGASSITNSSQSAVSRNIREIEKDYNSVLFNRNKRPLELTQEGAIFYNYVQRHEQLDILCRKELGHSSKGNIAIGSSFPVNWGMINLALDEYFRDFPESRIENVSCTRLDLYDKLRKGDISFAISPKELHIENTVLVATIVNIEWGLVIPPGMPQVSNKSIKANDIHNVPLIMPFDSFIFDMIETHLKTDLMFKKAEATFEDTCSLLEMMQEGWGASFITSNQKRYFENNQMRFVPLYPKLDAPFYLYSREYSTLDSFSKLLYDRLANTCIDFKKPLYEL